MVEAWNGSGKEWWWQGMAARQERTALTMVVMVGPCQRWRLPRGEADVREPLGQRTLLRVEAGRGFSLSSYCLRGEDECLLVHCPVQQRVPLQGSSPHHSTGRGQGPLPLILSLMPGEESLQSHQEREGQEERRKGL